MADEIDFHTGVADKLGYACRLLRKAYRSGRPVLVLGRAADLARLDRLLWVFDPGEFIPHARWRPDADAARLARLARAAVWLSESLPADHMLRPDQVVVNLGPEPVAEPDRCARLIELVAQDEADRAAGRERWRVYKAAGLGLRNHVQDLA